ncbi:MAG: histidine triad nucleotide-binding protein [Ruminococcus sp.]|nr:histidine triad nucleotide-binding protein [Ruminococcus sp.]MBR2304845.1 histidine triad nucleotide-binding protein [Ruminococcus sp.]
MNDCLFCKIIRGEIPSKKIYEDETVYVFEDINPTAPIHYLVIPKEHISKLDEVNETNSAVISHIYEVIAKLSKDLDIKGGFRVVSNCGESAGQSVFHIHFHLLAGRDFGWPAG